VLQVRQQGLPVLSAVDGTIGNALDLDGYPIRPFVVDGDRVYTAGVIPMEPSTGALVGGDIAVQTAQVLDNLTTILEAAGSSLADVLVVDVVLADVKRDFPAFNALYAERFVPPYPARRTIGGHLALAGLLIEIQVVARRAEP
jgi:enamine deaminase RidA (YjgF/YER057c/UK114 family)